jgi:hypothetical protein
VTIIQAERFAKKADAARDGTATQPEPAGTPAMAAGRARLLTLLGSPARERCPVFAALALARYDAWAERQRAWPNGEEAERFQKDFEENASALAGPCTRTS